MTAKTHTLYRVALRGDVQGQQLKPHVRQVLDGEVIALRFGWRIDSRDPQYPREAAMVPATPETARLFDEAGIAWISYSDVIPFKMPRRGQRWWHRLVDWVRA